MRDSKTFSSRKSVDPAKVEEVKAEWKYKQGKSQDFSDGDTRIASVVSNRFEVTAGKDGLDAHQVSLRHFFNHRFHNGANYESAPCFAKGIDTLCPCEQMRTQRK